MGPIANQLLAAITVLDATTSLTLLGRRHAAREVRRRGRELPATRDELERSSADVWRSCRAVSRAAGLAPWRVRCLPASFALHRLLEWQGVASAVRLGVRTSGDELVAHAWVECGGWKLDPLAPEEHYTALPSAAPDDATTRRHV